MPTQSPRRFAKPRLTRRPCRTHLRTAGPPEQRTSSHLRALSRTAPEQASVLEEYARPGNSRCSSRALVRTGRNCLGANPTGLKRVDGCSPKPYRWRFSRDGRPAPIVLAEEAPWTDGPPRSSASSKRFPRTAAHPVNCAGARAALRESQKNALAGKGPALDALSRPWYQETFTRGRSPAQFLRCYR